MGSIEEECFKKIIDEEEIFSGVSPENALEKISEKYNLDLSIYSRLLYDNNPLHLKLIIKTISENQLINKKVNSIAKGTYIYEQFIKKVLSKQDWNITQDIVKKMFYNRSKEIELSEIENLDAIDMKTYISKMKTNNFIGIYEYENKSYLYFINETLTDYLIARSLFEKIKEMDIKQTIKYINEMLKVFYSIHSQIIMMLFEKYKKKIEIAIKIVNNSELKNYFSIDIFNEISLNAINIKKIQKYIYLNKNIKNIYIVAGGNENNPFNCINYLNYRFIKTSKSNIMQYDKYDILKIRSKLKVYIQTISKFDYEKEYLKEKFWFGVWASSSVDKINRSLSKKLIFEIVNDKLEYVDILISLYNEVNDEYIKEMIIQVLCSQKKNITTIKNFLNIINTYEEVNIKNLYYISNYLYGYENYEKFSKLDLISLSDKRKNKNIFNFIHRVFFTFKYEYSFFGFNSYNDSINFTTKFIKENKSKITDINKYIIKNFKCLDINDCNNVYFKELFIDNKYNINEECISDDVIYLAWQKIFKKYLKKYNIKIKELNKIHIYEENEKEIVFKALDLSLSEINGSITCNYYTSEFEVYSNYKGYQLNLYDKYDEKEGFYYPISVFNQKIEELDNKIIKKIVLPKKKNITWVKNSMMGFENIKKIIEPIKYQKEEWYLIYGHVRLDGKSNKEYGNDWIDTYIVNWAINEKYNLCKYSEADRYYTIETQKYKGNIADYKLSKYSMTTSLHRNSDFKDVYATTDFNLPPTCIIKDYDLYYNKSTSSWNNKDGEIVVLVNNNKGTWYHTGCSGTLYLKKRYYDKIIEKYRCKYFCFTEKFHPSTGYCDDSALQIQIDQDNTITKYKHYKNHTRNTRQDVYCKNCIVYKKEKTDRKNLRFKFDDLILDDITDEIG